MAFLGNKTTGELLFYSFLGLFSSQIRQIKVIFAADKTKITTNRAPNDQNEQEKHHSCSHRLNNDFVHLNKL